jgi:sugar lactone lactonase YvrE
LGKLGRPSLRRFLVRPRSCRALSACLPPCFARALVLRSLLPSAFPPVRRPLTPPPSRRPPPPFSACSLALGTSSTRARFLCAPHGFFVLFALLAFCSGQSVSPTTSPSPSITPCSAQPGFFCNGGSALICPIGAYCAGGSALNVSCYPVTACTVAGLSAQPPCYWNVSTLAGNGAAGSANGIGTAASFNFPRGIVSAADGRIYVGDEQSNALRVISSVASVTTLSSSFSGHPMGVSIDLSGVAYVAEQHAHVIRKVTPSGTTTVFLGSGVSGSANGVGVSATFSNPSGISIDSGGNLFIADLSNGLVRRATPSGAVSTVASGFSAHEGVAVANNGVVYVADSGNQRIKAITNGSVSIVAGSGLAGSSDGFGTSASFNGPYGITVDSYLNVFVAEYNGNRVRMIKTSREVVTIAGSGLSAAVNGFGSSASFFGMQAISVSLGGVLYAADSRNHRIRQLTCVPCPVSYYCYSGSPVLCPAGSYCPLSSINATLCPIGTISSVGASNCTLCPAGTYTLATGSSSCKQCPGGHYCPAGASSWARLNCGLGNYCPDGSGAPTPCPYQVPPPGGWGALQVQGPAFLVETAHCLNRCFWNFTSGDGMLSKC